VDSLQECCHCNDMSVVITSIDLVNDLLTSVEQLINSDVPQLNAESSLIGSTPSDTDIGMNDMSFTCLAKAHRWAIGLRD